MFQRTQKSRGFTLIELLVVIAIIGLLSSIILASLNGARKKGRDARRLADLKSLQLALELYNSDQSGSAYPAALSSLTPKYITVLPTDPSTSANYNYVQNGLYYCVGATLETTPLPVSSCNTTSTGLNTTAPAGNYLVSP